MMLRHVLAARLSSELDWPRIADRAAVRPRDRRTQELFLSHLAALHPVLRRFDPLEIDPPCFYLCQMLRFEFPWASRSLLKDDVALGSLECTRLDAGTLPRERPESAPGLEHAPLWGRKRFLAICAAIREAREATASRSLRALFQLVDRPPVLTGREMQLVWSAFRTAPSAERARVLRTFFAPKGMLVAARSDALLTQAVRLRDRLLNRCVERSVTAEVGQALDDVRSATDLIATLLRDLQVVGRGQVSASACSDLVDHTLKWSHSPVVGRLPLHDDEIDLLRLAVDFTPERRLRDVYNHSRQARTKELRSRPRANLTALLDHLQRRLDRVARSPLAFPSGFPIAAR